MEAGGGAEIRLGAGLVLSPAHRRPERGQQRSADSVALVQPIESEPGDTVTQLVSHSALGTHSCASYWHQTPPWRLGRSICVGLELQKVQQEVVPLASNVGKIGAAQLLGHAPRNRRVELFVESYVAQLAPPTFERWPKMLQHMGDAASAAGQVQIEERAEQCPT